jgi:hypothetical protein
MPHETSYCPLLRLEEIGPIRPSCSRQGIEVIVRYVSFRSRWHLAISGMASWCCRPETRRSHAETKRQPGWTSPTILARQASEPV